MKMSSDVVAAARAAGCVSAELEENRGGRFRVHCSCGYSSTYRRTRVDAFEALAHHLSKVTGARVADGVSLPRSVGAGL